jgi:hypothetical protein
VKNFIGTSTTEFVWPNFSGVNDTAEINVTLLKSQTDFTGPYSSFKGKIQQKYFNGNIPILYKYKKQKKSWGLPRPHFRFQRCQ